MEEELVSIVMVIEEFCSMLLGIFVSILITKISHSPILTVAMSYTGVHLWKCMVPPPSNILAKNVLANTFLHLPHHDVSPIPEGKNTPVALFDFTSKGLDISNDPELLEFLSKLSLPDIEKNNPVDLKWIHIQQNMGIEFATKATKYPDGYFYKLIDDHIIVCHALLNEDHLTQWKIEITKEMKMLLIK